MLHRIKMIKGLLLSTCIVLTGCASQKKTFTNAKKIDIKHVKEIWSATPKARHHEFRLGDTIVRLIRIENDLGQINIVEEIASSKNIIKTKGRISEGLKRLEYNPSDPIVTRKYYYPLGQLSWVGQFYSEKYLKDRFAEIEYPIREIFQYNESGVLIKHERINELILFNFDKVKQKVLEMDPNAKITVVRLNGDIHKSPIWNINYVSVDNRLSALNIDSRTGEIVSQGHNIKMYE